MVQATVLKVADPSKPFVLQTDASELGLGAVLSQKDDDGNEHPVAYESRKLLPREANYAGPGDLVWMRFSHEIGQ